MGVAAPALHALAYNLASFIRTLAKPTQIEAWSLTSVRERLIKTGARLVRHARYAVFQMAEALPNGPTWPRFKAGARAATPAATNI